MIDNKILSLSLDKLDQEQLNALKERTGKSEADILKLALNELHRKLVDNQPDQKQAAPVIYITPPVYQPYYPPPPYIPQIIPFTPYQPFTPTVPEWIGKQPQIVYDDGHETTCIKYDGNGNSWMTIGNKISGTINIDAGQYSIPGTYVINTETMLYS